ncbi:MAG: hypothetical protein MGG37_05855, partial [Trichodesmium sp. MAG_R01]|nr:hypothetical protein [Trichodesmium sp. MAG_R01]
MSSSLTVNHGEYSYDNKLKVGLRFYRTYLGSFFAVQAIANLLSISLTKQRLILVVAFSRVPINF